MDFLLAAKKNGWLGQLVGLENDLPRLPKRTAAWIPRYQPGLVPESQNAPAAGSRTFAEQRKRPFTGDDSVEVQMAKRRRTGREEKCTRPCRTGKMERSSSRTARQRSSSRTVRMIATPEKSLSPVKQNLVDRVKTRRRSITPFPAGVSNPIVARVLTKETEHPSLGRETRASEKKKRERSQRVFTYDEQQESLPQGAEGEEWMDREGFCEQYELE